MGSDSCSSAELSAANWIVGFGGGGGCTDGAIATALAVSVATPAMRTERAESSQTPSHLRARPG